MKNEGYDRKSKRGFIFNLIKEYEYITNKKQAGKENSSRDTR